MDTSQEEPCDIYGPNGTIQTLTRHLKSELFFVSSYPLTSHKRLTTELTTGAICTICVLLFVIVLAVIGSSITLYESFLKVIVRKHDSCNNGFRIRASCQKKVTKTTPESLDYNAWQKWSISFFNCFCVITNGRKTLSFTTGKSEFNFIHGIRSLTTAYVIFLHCTMFFMCVVKVNETFVNSLRRWYMQLFFNGLVVSDTFFVISGFLSGYIFFSLYDKTKGNISWLQFYTARFIRLTPVYMIVYWYHTYLTFYTSLSPTWPAVVTNPFCTEDWLWNILYINNFKPFLTQCMMWSWYLACEMQFYIISPLFLVSIFRWSRMGYILSAVCICVSCYANFVIVMYFNLVDGFSKLPFHAADIDLYFFRITDYVERIHTKPYTKFNTYLIGILVAYYLYRRGIRNGTPCSKLVLYCGWSLTGIGMWISFFAIHHRAESLKEIAVLVGVKDLIFSCAVGWIIFVCFIGQGGFVSKFLSSKVFIPFSRLSYCMYLIHSIFIFMQYKSIESTESADPINLIPLYLRVYSWSLVAAFIVSLLFEQPVLRLRLLFTDKPKKE